MRKVTTSDIRRRQNSLNRLNYYNEFITKNIEERFNEKYNFQQAKILLEHWYSMANNTEIAFDKSLNILESSYENGTNEEFIFIKNYIIENIIPTVRDGSQAANYVKMRTRKFKSKIGTKITNKVDIMKNAVKDSNDDNKNKLDIKNTSSTNKNIEETLQEMQESLNVYIQCDRVLENNRKLLNRYNINNIISECYSPYDVQNTIHLFCEFVDTYDTPLKIKYNVALEQINYNLEKAGIKFNKADMINQVTDYFLCRDIMEESTIDDIKYILSNNKFFTESDLSMVRYIFDNTDVQPVNEFSELNSYIEESKVDEVKKIIDEYKLKKEKNPEDLRGLISKIYTRSSDNIINDMPNILSWIRFAFVLSTFKIHAVVGIVAIIIDQFIKLHLSRKETSKMITSFENERKAVASKLKNTKDKDIIFRLKEYDNKLQDGLKKLKAYSEDLLSEKEKEELNNDDDGFDFDLESVNVASALESISESYENLHSKQEITSLLENVLKNHLKDLSNIDIDIITECYKLFPDCINKDKLLEYYAIELERSKDELNMYDKWNRCNCIKENMQNIQTSIIENTILSFNESVLQLNVMEELLNMCKDIEEYKVVNENITSSLKLAMNKFKKAITKLSDKEKSMSRTIDASFNTFTKGIERAVRNDNREAIIRGSIVPSASKIVKGAIVTGAVAFVNPAVAVIGALGALATSKRMKYKERQLVLDEIEIELKMCDRYLRQAEDNNDLEAQKQILTTQRALERQKQRIKYKMTIYYDQNVPDIKKDDD